MAFVIPLIPRESISRLIPAEIAGCFDDAFIDSCELIQEYVSRLALEIFNRLELGEICQGGATLEEVLERARLLPEVARVPIEWIFTTLARRGWMSVKVDAHGRRCYRAAALHESVDPAEIREMQSRVDPSSLPAFSIAALAAQHYPSVLRGERSGEEALFDAPSIGAWIDYFSNRNPLYAINNVLGAVAAARALPSAGGAILELGGGLGSAAEAVLAHLIESGRGGDISAYRFTEITPMFLRRARKLLAADFPDCPLSFDWLDIDKPFPPNVAPRAGIALVYGVNVLHVARDLSAALGRIREVLRPDGALVISECVRPFPGQPVYVEFVFNLLRAFRDPLIVPAWRPNGGFLTPEQWTLALQENGFMGVRVYPDICAIRDAYPAFLVAAITARPAG